MIKAIAMDIDGTLLNSEKKLTEKTKEALLKAQEKGITLILASGRPIMGMQQFVDKLKLDKNHGLIVCFNGSRVVDCETNEVLFNQAMSIEEGKAVLEHLKKFPGARPMIDKGEYMYVNDVFDNTIKYHGKDFNVMQYEARGNHYILCEKRDLAEFVDYEINKILTFGDPEYMNEVYDDLKGPFEGKLNCVFTSEFYIEYTANGIDKAKALDTVLKERGIDALELIAFGDGQNDATMLEYAGIGVAMANATHGLEKYADEVTLSNDEDGIAASLYKHIPNL